MGRITTAEHLRLSFALLSLLQRFHKWCLNNERRPVEEKLPDGCRARLAVPGPVSPG